MSKSPSSILNHSGVYIITRHDDKDMTLKDYAMLAGTHKQRYAEIVIHGVPLFINKGNKDMEVDLRPGNLVQLDINPPKDGQQGVLFHLTNVVPDGPSELARLQRMRHELGIPDEGATIQ